MKRLGSVSHPPSFVLTVIGAWLLALAGALASDGPDFSGTWVLEKGESTVSNEAMFVGLIHDVGKLYLLSRAKKHPDLFACPGAMAQIMSEWHAEIGKAVVESWELPDHVVQAVSAHGDHERHKYGPPDVIDVLIVANVVANAMEQRTIDELDFDGVSAFARLEIDASVVDKFVTESREELDALMSALRG